MNEQDHWECEKTESCHCKDIYFSLDDTTSSATVELFPNNGELISVGTRINWNGVVKRAAVDLWDTEENNHGNAPTLWEYILYRDGYRIIPEVITAGMAFAKD